MALKDTNHLVIFYFMSKIPEEVRRNSASPYKYFKSYLSVIDFSKYDMEKYPRAQKALDLREKNEE